LKSAIRNYAILFFGSILFHLAGTWSVPLVDRDEPRFAEASREMIERGNYVVPYFNNHFRFDKPPLAYWAQVGSYRIFGENDFAARFPSAIAAALVAMSIVAWGSRIGPARIGWWAAIIFTLSLQTFLHAKAAVADMWLVLFVTVGNWGGYELLRDLDQTSPRPLVTPYHYRRWWLVFYLSLALGFLAKGPIAWTPLLTILAMKLFLPGTRLAQRFKFARGIGLTLLVVALWGIPALIQTHGEFFAIGLGRHVIARSFGAMEGHGANSLGGYLLLLPFYFVTVFFSFFPWSIKLPSIARKLWGSRDNIDNYLLAGAIIIFIVFSLIKTKLPHYILPAFPLLSLLVARQLSDRDRFFKRVAVSAACAYLAIALFAAPFAARFFPATQLYRESRDYLRPEMDFGALNFQEPSLVWYFRARVDGWMTTLDTTSTREFMDMDGPRFVILPTVSAMKLFSNPPADWKTFSTRGFNIAKGKSVDLTLVLKPE
jgi:4-amino-4-deoxy-L-arabinose transferase-like glycosyltransferase